jgi:hypothetical protein
MKNYKIDTESKYFNEPEDYLKYLLCEGEIIINNGWWDKEWPEDRITVAVLCNDIFAWGCSDAEEVLCGELEEVARAHMKDPIWGIPAWCIKKRKMMPQEPVAKAMTAAGYDLNSILGEV